LTVTTWRCWLPWVVWRRGWKDHHPRRATRISELNAEAMGGGLALAKVTGDRERVDLASVSRPQCRDGVGKTSDYS
jgi:hypothetical protein